MSSSIKLVFIIFVFFFLVAMSLRNSAATKQFSNTQRLILLCLLLVVTVILLVFVLIGPFSLVIFFAIGIAALGLGLATTLVIIANTAASRRTSSILRFPPFLLAALGIVELLLFGFLGIFAFLVWQSFTAGSGDFSFFLLISYIAAAFFACLVVFVIGIVISRQRLHAQEARDEETRLLFERIRAALPLERPLFVYLRPFSAVKEQTSTEELMIQIFEHRGILICVDEPGFQYGMGRLILSAGEWQIAVRLLCERAAVIVMYPGASAGVLWELGEIFNCGWLDRTLFFMPPNPISIFGPAFRPTFKQLMQNNPRVGSAKAAARFNEIDIGGNWEEARARAREIGVILPAYCDDGGMFRIRSGRLEWLTVFARNLFFGKSPKRSLEALGPIIDAYVSNTNSVPALR